MILFLLKPINMFTTSNIDFEQVAQCKQQHAACKSHRGPQEPAVKLGVEDCPHMISSVEEFDGVLNQVVLVGKLTRCLTAVSVVVLLVLEKVLPDVELIGIRIGGG